MWSHLYSSRVSWVNNSTLCVCALNLSVLLGGSRGAGLVVGLWEDIIAHPSIPMGCKLPVPLPEGLECHLLLPASSRLPPACVLFFLLLRLLVVFHLFLFNCRWGSVTFAKLVFGLFGSENIHNAAVISGRKMTNRTGHFYAEHKRSHTNRLPTEAQVHPLNISADMSCRLFAIKHQKPASDFTDHLSWETWAATCTLRGDDVLAASGEDSQ